MEPNDWIMSRDTGTSSKTIWWVMMGGAKSNYPTSQSNRFDIPYDPDDFGRCYRLLQLFPEWRDRLPEVAAVFPKWGPMVREWDAMTLLFEQAVQADNTEFQALYDLMKTLEEEGCIADGWKKTGPGCYSKAPG